MEINQIMIGEKVIQIKGVKLKYMSLGWYKGYIALKEQGLIKLLGTANGTETLMVFLQGILDISKIEGELLEDLNENLNENLMKEIIKITERVNEIKE